MKGWFVSAKSQETRILIQVKIAAYLTQCVCQQAGMGSWLAGRPMYATRGSPEFTNNYANGIYFWASV